MACRAAAASHCARRRPARTLATAPPQRQHARASSRRVIIAPGSHRPSMRTCPALTFSNFWTMPEGQRISIELGHRSPPKPDDQPLVAGREIADRSVDGEVLSHAGRRHHLHAASDAVAIRFRADGANADPVVAVAAVVAQHVRLLADVADDDVDVAIVIEIAERGAAAGPVLSETPRPASTRTKRPDSLRSSSGGCRYCRFGDVFSMVSITWPCATNRSFQPSLS